MEAEVRQLRPREAGAAAPLLVRSFADDPFIGYFFRGPRRRRLALPPFFAAVLHSLLPSREVFALAVGGRVLGVAAWLPPEPLSASRQARLRANAATARVRFLFPRASPALGLGFEMLGSHHPPDPHWYLAFVGIDPDEQRRGLGRQLLSPVLDRADRESSICYLETPFPDTRAFYHRLGFVNTSELNHVPGAPTIWTMTRQPG